MVIKRMLVLAAAVLVSGCALEKQTAPPLSGPSELGLSLAVTATPDVLTQDGVSEATVEIVARDANSQPVRGLTLRLDTFVGSIPVDFGALSSKTVSTGNDGKATLRYLSPGPPPPSAESDVVVSIGVTPVGSNYANSGQKFVQIRLARPGVILPPNGAPRPSFIFSPQQPREEDDVFFDGSGSSDPDGQIVSYSWSFGDGRTATGVTARHHYGLAGSYSVTLTVVDDRGISATSAPQTVQIGTSAVPTADFSFSPTAPIVNQVVSFNGSPSTATNGREIVSWEWDFGDGTPPASGKTVQHTFTVEGAYAVVLNVLDDVGKRAVVSKSVNVARAVPKADFTVSPSTGTTATVFTFNGGASSAPPGRTIATYTWSFGGAGTQGGTAVAPTFQYTGPGTYTVTLVVTDNTGVTSDVASKTVTVTP